MEKDNSNEFKNNFSNEFTDKLSLTKTYHDFFQNVQNVVCNSSNVSLVNMDEFLLDHIRNSTSSKHLFNLILSQEERKKQTIGSNSYLIKAQLNWEKKIVKSFNSLCTDFNLPLSKKRHPAEAQDIKRLWNELGTNVNDIKKFRCIFTVDEFLEHLLSIKCNNLTELASQSITGLINVPIKIKSFPEIKEHYKNLSIDYFQSGLDENLNSIIESERLKTGQKVYDINDVLLTREFAKQGCIKSLRGKLWSQMLNVKTDGLDKVYYNYLKNCVLEYDLLIDTIYYRDVKMTAVNDDQVFVFEDMLYQMLLMFSRDTHVLKCYDSHSVQVPKAFIKGKLSSDQYKQVTYPPNGFIPFDGFSMIVAPLCFVYSDPVELYYIFRKFFMTHFFKLTLISSDPQSILGLCALFENILQAKDPQLFFHLRKIDVQPLKIVFKWIIKGFSGYLLSSQLLELWDRVLAYNSLEILSIFAAGVFLYRKQNIISVGTKTQIESILDDLTSLKVVAILQLMFI